MCVSSLLDQGQGVMQARHAALAAGLLLPGVLPLTPCAFCCLLLHRLLLGGRSPALQTHTYTLTQPHVSTHTRETNSHPTIRMCCSSHAACPPVQAFCCVTPGPDSSVSIQRRQADQMLEGQDTANAATAVCLPSRLPACPQRRTSPHSPLSRGSALGSVV